MTDDQIIKALKELLEIMLHEGDLQRSSTISNTLDLLEHKDAEIERLTTMNSELNIGIKKLKEFAIKEFAERLKEKRDGGTYPYALVNVIDDLVEEMTKPAKLKHNSLCETETYMGE